MIVCVIVLIYCGCIDGVSHIEELMKAILKNTASISLLSSWTVLGVICAFSYAVGAIIYRCAPKVPDAIASYRQWRESNGKDALAVDFDRLTINGHVGVGMAGWPFSKGEAIRAKFGHQIDCPYPHLRRYLAYRGHYNLLKYVSWCADPSDDDKVQEKSKIQINMIKQIVATEGDGILSRDLIRNESHIRLLNSLWYIFRFLQQLFVVFGIILIVRYIAIGFSLTYHPFVIQWSLSHDATSDRFLIPIYILFCVHASLAIEAKHRQMFPLCPYS